ncbi:MAG: GDP-L-fucose synthase family protein [Acidimicrobiales bacterium]
MSVEIPLESPIFVAGHRGLVGSALVARLEREGFTNLLLATRRELDLRDASAVTAWMEANRPEMVFLVAGTVGGIMANSTRPAEFLFDNMMIHASVIEASRLVGVRRLLYLGSSCIYPRGATQPIREEALLTGPLEPTNEAYAIAKIAGIRLCETYRTQYGCDFISAMPTNLYGPRDNFGLESSHVLPAMIRKFYEARQRGDRTVTIWGSGTPMREFLHVEDLADCCLFLMRHYDGAGHINVGTGQELSIADLADIVRRIVYPEASIVYDDSKPDGMPRKVLDVTRLHQLGWKASTPLDRGIADTYAWFLDHQADLRRNGEY